MSASFFSNSRNFRVESGTFITANNYINVLSPPIDEKRAFDCLLENIAEEAIHNSDERCNAPKVHPETRKAVQEEILGWITHGDDDAEPKKILWVSGPAGAGKTAIAGSIAELCEEQGLLAGSFFFSSFSGSEKRRTKRCVVATLVYSMLQHDGLQTLRGHILSIIERDPTVFRKRLKDQCRLLLQKPFQDAFGELHAWKLPKVIIIDGLDEVESPNSRQLENHEARVANEAEQLEILSGLLQIALEVKFPFRIVVVSRPERVIRDFFYDSNAKRVSREIFLDEKYNPDSDISIFFKAKFAEIRRRYKMAHIWPGEDDIRRLVDTASGQFIYAATVIRFLQSGKHPNPQALLRDILDPAVSQDPALNALSSLDALYRHILMSSPDPPLATRWIGAIDQHKFVMKPAKFVRQLLQEFEGQADYLLENLASLVRIPPVEAIHSGYDLYHTSFVDFLSSKHRCGPALNESYNSGSDLFCSRWFNILQFKSPVVPIAGAEWPEFLSFFLLSIDIDLERAWLMKYTSGKGTLATCDVIGLVRMVCAAHSNNPGQKVILSRLSYTFQSIHRQCPASQRGAKDCFDACRHWRSCILGECRRLGWKVPTPAELLRESMSDACGWDFEDWTSEPYFQPPEACSQRSVPFPRAIDEDPVRQKAYVEGYKALCELIDSVYRALPTDWAEEYLGELKRGRTKTGAARGQLRRVDPNLRARVKGLDEWLSFSDANEERGDGFEGGAAGVDTRAK